MRRGSTVENAFYQYRGAMVNWRAEELEGEPDHQFHNNGDGTFINVTVKVGRRGQPALLRIHHDLHRQKRRWKV
jgi:hypothetical protein